MGGGEGSRNQADNMGPDPIWLLSLQGRSNHDVEIKSMQSVEGQLWRTQVKVPSASQQRDLGRTSPASTRSRKQMSSVEAPDCGILL